MNRYITAVKSRKAIKDPILRAKEGKQYFQFPGLLIRVFYVGLVFVRIGFRDGGRYYTMLVDHQNFRELILN